MPLSLSKISAVSCIFSVLLDKSEPSHSVSRIPPQSFTSLSLLFLCQRSTKRSVQNVLIPFFTPLYFKTPRNILFTFHYVYLVNHMDRNPQFHQGHFQLSGLSWRVREYENSFNGIYASCTSICSQGIYPIMSSLLLFI